MGLWTAFVWSLIFIVKRCFLKTIFSPDKDRMKSYNSILAIRLISVKFARLNACAKFNICKVSMPGEKDFDMLINLIICQLH